MQKKGQIANNMIMLSVMVIIGIVILGIVAVFLQGTTTSETEESETVSTTLNSTTTLGNKNIIESSLLVYNGSSVNDVQILAGNYTLDAPAGTIVVTNETDVLWAYFPAGAVTGDLVYNYSYTPGGFVTNSTARTLIDLIPLMFALVILIAVLVIGGVIAKSR